MRTTLSTVLIGAVESTETALKCLAERGTPARCFGHAPFRESLSPLRFCGPASFSREARR